MRGKQVEVVVEPTAEAGLVDYLVVTVVVTIVVIVTMVVVVVVVSGGN